jgi:hypothetical protein
MPRLSTDKMVDVRYLSRQIELDEPRYAREVAPKPGHLRQPPNVTIYYPLQASAPASFF